MEIENQLSSLELSKRLEELNVKQDSIFCYVDGILCIEIEGEFFWVHKAHYTQDCWKSNDEIAEKYSAFTIVEIVEIIKSYHLLDMVVKLDMVVNQRGNLYFNKESNDYINAVCKNKIPLLIIDVNFWAEVLIYLIENNLIKV